MRPVNLIPPDERSGDRSPMRTGILSYVLIGAMALALLGVIGLVFTSKQVSDRKAEVAKLQQGEQQAAAKAQSLQAFTNFRAIQESRNATVSSLAQSRFDWQRVLNELARVIPPDVWLVQLSGTVNPSVQLDNAPDVSIRASVPGPALTVVGCAPSQDAVAGLVSDLQDIDGVTRVGVQSSERPDDPTTGTATASSDSAQGSADDCRTRDFITKFELVVAFDAVPTPGTATSAPSVPSSVASSGGSALTAQSTPASTGGG
ncbi:MAG: PilN domain-containing protein [Solirubrobacterales bacterium]